MAAKLNDRFAADLNPQSDGNRNQYIRTEVHTERHTILQNSSSNTSFDCLQIGALSLMAT